MEVSPSDATLDSPPRSEVMVRGEVQRHIVLLDDDESIIQALSRLLVAAGMRVTATLNAREAMEVVVCRGADAIVADLHMPDMGGNLVLSMLAQAAPHVARILMTNDTDFSRVAPLVVPYSVDAFVSKHDASTRLVPALRDVLTRRRVPVDSESAARSLSKSIVRALSLRDYETEVHCERVAAWSARLAMELRMTPSRLLDVELGALLHDVGKIGVRDAVLLKPGKLTEDEWKEMRRHPDLGVALLSDIPALRRAIPVVHSHHERRDGKGYPRGLAGDEIPVEARIFQIADTYDAIVSDRPYRRGQSDEEARAEICRFVGPQFDPAVHAVFLRIPPDEWRKVVAGLV